MADLGEQLYEACTDKNQTEAERLLDAGADKEWRNPQGAGWTPIIVAAAWGSPTVKLLADRGADIHARARNRMNALMHACSANYIECASFLLERGADIHARDNEGRDALLHAALFGYIELSLMLIDRQADARCSEEAVRTGAVIAAWLAGSHPSQVQRRKDENWNRRRAAMLFLVSSGFQPTEAQRLEQQLAQLAVDTSAPLDPIDRSTPEANLAYLCQQVFGHAGLARIVLGYL